MEPPGKLQRLAGIVLTVAMIWFMLPNHQRQLILMRTARGLQRVAARAARREGHAGMGDELGGRQWDADRRYSVALFLSRARDWSGRMFERVSP